MEKMKIVRNGKEYFLKVGEKTIIENGENLVTVELHQYHGENHKNHLFYGDVVVSMICNNYFFDIRSVGDVRAKYLDEYIVDKNNSGKFFDELGKVISDVNLVALIEKEELEVMNNNWFDLGIAKKGEDFAFAEILDSPTIDEAVCEALDMIDEMIERIS